MTDSGEIEQAVSYLRSGGLVAFPTETVYGLGADAENASAVARLFAVKGRPAEHPLIVHLSSGAELPNWAATLSDAAVRLAEQFWPGPLTLIVRRAPRIAPNVTGGLETVGLRVPAHPLALELLSRFGGGVAAPSANRFGKVSPTTAEHVRHDLGSDVDQVLDGGPCRVGVESTIVDVSGEEPRLLRYGGITQEAVEAALRRPVSFQAGGAVRAPGQLEAHYAPRAEVQLVPLERLSVRAHELAAEGKLVAVLNATAGFVTGVSIHELRVPSDPTGYARELYAALREADRLGCDVVLASPPERAGIGAAIADRLQRAAVGSSRQR